MLEIYDLLSDIYNCMSNIINMRSPLMTRAGEIEEKRARRARPPGGGYCVARDGAVGVSLPLLPLIPLLPWVKTLPASMRRPTVLPVMLLP